MTVSFEKTENNLILIYTPRDTNGWLYDKFKENDSYTISRIFDVSKKNLVEPYDLNKEYDEDEPIRFIFGTKVDDGYFLINKEILNINFELYLHNSIKLSSKQFIIPRNFSVFRELEKLQPAEIYIGGKHHSNVSEEDFNSLVKSLPSDTEIDKYIVARTSAIFREYFPLKIDGEEKYNEYLNKKIKIKESRISNIFAETELEKFNLLLNRLEKMLDDKICYTEDQWQEEISQFILLIFPKYIKVFREAKTKGKKRVDFILVDANGNIDILEIKRPPASSEEQSLVTKTPYYRGNHVPLRELSGSIMQIEKYIYELNKSGIRGEKNLNKQFKDKLPKNFDIKITNPSGIIIMGRCINMSSDQKNDFEIIKRKYKNIVDIITYDDLLERLRIMVDNFKSKTAHSTQKV